MIVVDEIEYGTGSASTRQGARDEAARKALQQLQAEMRGRVSLLLFFSQLVPASESTAVKLSIRRFRWLPTLHVFPFQKAAPLPTIGRFMLTAVYTIAYMYVLLNQVVAIKSAFCP